MAEDRSRTEAEQLNKSPQERVRNRFSGVPRTLSELERQEERTEQELQHNENSSEVQNTDENSETFNILENEIIANESTDVGIHDTYNEYHEGGGAVDVHQARNHNIGGNSIYSNKGKRAGISKVGNKYYKKSSLQPVMEHDGSNRYSAKNKITGDGAADVGIFELPNSDVNRSNAAQGQGGGRGKKPQDEGHKIEYHMKRTSQSKIYENTIAATKGESGVGISSFHNVYVNGNNGGQGQGSREFEGICHNIYHNKITADNGSTKVGFGNC